MIRMQTMHLNNCYMNYIINILGKILKLINFSINNIRLYYFCSSSKIILAILLKEKVFTEPLHSSQFSSQQTLVFIYPSQKDGKLSKLWRKRRSHVHSNLSRAWDRTEVLVVGLLPTTPVQIDSVLFTYYLPGCSS